MKIEDAIFFLRIESGLYPKEDEMATCDAQEVTCNALDVIIAGAEKQIPKEPITEPSFGAYCCPACGRILVGRIEAGKRVEIKHCNECGQAIKWLK